QSVGTTATSTVWQPPLIRVPVSATAGTTTGVTIMLTNTLPVETSLVIYGQAPAATDVNNLGAPVRESGRTQHPTQTATTWTQVLTNQAPFTPPTQGARVRSFVTEVAAASATAAGTANYTFNNLF